MDAEYRIQIEALYFELYDKAMVYARSALDSEVLAEEAVQETFRIACQKPQSVCGSPNPQGWIIQTLKYTIRNIRTNQASTKRMLERYMLTQVDNISISDNQINISILYENVADLEEFQLLKEFAFEKQSHQEMAAKRGITVSACRKRLQRAKETLHRKLKNSV